MTHKNKKPRHVGLKRTILGMIISALIFPALILFTNPDMATQNPGFLIVSALLGGGIYAALTLPRIRVEEEGVDTTQFKLPEIHGE